MPVKIFVGNLSPETTSDALNELFADYGNVVEADALGKFGFVHMETMEDAEAAIAALNGRDYDGAAIKVEISQAGKKDKGGRNNSARITSPKVFVGNLNDSITSEDLREHFSKCGTVTEADAKGKFGFVHMSTADEAARCIKELKGSLIGNTPINVETSEDKRPPRDAPPRELHGAGRRRDDGGPVKLFVGNLNDNITTDDLKKLFGKAGVVSECATKGRYGFVHMETWDDAQNAVRMCDKYQLKGQTLNVEESQGGGGGGGGGRGGGGPRDYGRDDDFRSAPSFRGSRDNTVKIFIGNMTEDTTTEDLVDLFSRYGRVKESDSNACGKFGFIHMFYMDDAERAINELNGTNLRGSRLNVELSQRGDKGGGGGGPDRRGRGGGRDRPYERSRDPPRDAMAVAEYYQRTGRIPGSDLGMRSPMSSRDPYPSSFSSFDRERSAYDSFRDRDPYRDAYSRPSTDSYRQSVDPFARPPPEAYQGMASKRLEDYERLARERQYQQQAAAMSMDRMAMDSYGSRFMDDRMRGNSGYSDMIGSRSNGSSAYQSGSNPYSSMYGSYMGR